MCWFHTRRLFNQWMSNDLISMKLNAHFTEKLWLPTTKLLLLCTKPGVSPIPSVLRGRRSWENSVITTYKSRLAFTLISVSIAKYDQHPLIQSSRLRLISKSKWPGLPLLEVEVTRTCSTRSRSDQSWASPTDFSCHWTAQPLLRFRRAMGPHEAVMNVIKFIFCFNYLLIVFI